MIASTCLLYAVQCFAYDGIKMSLPEHLWLGLDCTHWALWVLLPVTGWVAESWLGRYRSFVVGLLMCTITLFLMEVAFTMLNFGWNPTQALVLVIGSLIFGTLGIGGLYTNMLPFTLDQMIGASAEELSAIVQWYYWGFNIPLLIRNILPCVPITLHLPGIVPMTFLFLSFLSSSSALVMDCLCHKWLDTHNKTGNPIKLIFQVLNYARKNKYPCLRSAFTYIDEEQPSRLDFGKHKFGGPFTEEEVEDVKTAFRLTPLLMSIIGPSFTLAVYDQFDLHAILTTKQTFECIKDLKETLSYATAFLLIPIYRFIVYPLVGKHVPSMLKIMGMGLLLCLVTMVTKFAIDSTEHFYSNASHCIFDGKGATGTIPIPLYWVLIIEIVNGIGVVVTMCSLFEFVMAQAPNRMRGIMMGLIFTLFGIEWSGMGMLTIIFRQFQTAASCMFYYYLVLSLLMLLILVVYVILAKRYKLRERDKHINIHVIVEEHYERYFDQEEEYMRETANRY